MDGIEELIGSISQNDFVLGLLLARDVETFGDLWEKVIDCNHCKFAKQCARITEYFVGKDQCENITCGQIINLLTGDMTY